MQYELLLDPPGKRQNWQCERGRGARDIATGTFFDQFSEMTNLQVTETRAHMESGLKTAHINGKVRVSLPFLFLFFSVLTIYEFIIINFWVIFFLFFF